MLPQQLPVLLPRRVSLLPPHSCCICSARSPPAVPALPSQLRDLQLQLCCGSLLPLPRTVRLRAKRGLGALLFRNVPGLAALYSLDPLGRSGLVAAAVAVGVGGRGTPAVGVGVTLPTVRCSGLAHAQINSSSAASATMPMHVSPTITGQNGVVPPPSSSGSPDGGDTGTGAAGGGGVMDGWWMPWAKRWMPLARFQGWQEGSQPASGVENNNCYTRENVTVKAQKIYDKCHGHIKSCTTVNPVK